MYLMVVLSDRAMHQRLGTVTRIFFFASCLFWINNCFYVNLVSGQMNDKKVPLQPDDINNGTFDDLSKNNPDICTRVCNESTPRKICYYRFVLEHYHTLSQSCRKCPGLDLDCFLPQCIYADGYERGILTVNRRLPGPSIQVCKGDTVVVDVKNNMPGRSTTIHWHGIRQTGTPYMDGVPMITQCPILTGNIFRYKFIADSAGTFFWHSHDGFQKMDGIIGSFVVRESAKSEINSDLYDDDLPSHVVLIQDWMHLDSDQRFPGLLSHDVGQEPDTYLINGRGNYPKLIGNTNTPFSQFEVTAGRRYRFRFIAGSCLSCPFQVTIENHPLLLIATESTPVEPVVVNSFNMWAGDRYDFVLDANKRPNAYWIFVRGLGLCSRANQAAVLKYKSWPLLLPLTGRPPFYGLTRGVVLNPENSGCQETDDGICVSELRGKRLMDKRLLALHPNFRILLTFGFHIFTSDELFYQEKYPRFFSPITGTPMAAWINNISNIMPASPLLTQLEDVPLSMFCSQKCLEPLPNSKPCQCINLIKVPFGSTVELIMIDPSPLNFGLSHPMHIHGFNFKILAQGRFKPKEDLNVAIKKLQKHLIAGTFIKANPPVKDTINIPAFGYAIVRFVADNPGYWYFHCHFLYHHVAGMSAVFQVGEHEDLPKPPSNFQKCGDFIPSINATMKNR